MWRIVTRSPAQAWALAGAYFVSWVNRQEVSERASREPTPSRREASLWEQKTSELESVAIQELIHESNAKQDADLNRIITALGSMGFHQYAICLGKFLLLKQHIEDELHQDGQLTRKKAEIEQLVDALCHSICNEITELTELESQLADVLTSQDATRLEYVSQRRTKCHQRLQHAYQTVNDTTQRLAMMLRPGGHAIQATDEEARVLDRLIEQLQEENLIAQRVHEQLTDDSLRLNRETRQ